MCTIFEPVSSHQGSNAELFLDCIELLANTLLPLISTPTHSKSISQQNPHLCSFLEKSKSLVREFSTWKTTGALESTGPISASHLHDLELIVAELKFLIIALDVPGLELEMMKARNELNCGRTGRWKLPFVFCGADGCGKTANLLACTGVSSKRSSSSNCSGTC